MSSRRVVLVSVIAVLVIVQLAVVFIWVRPRVLRYYTPTSIIQRLDTDTDHALLYQSHQLSNTSSDTLSVHSRLSAIISYSHSLLNSGHRGSIETADQPAPYPINSSTLSHLFHTSGPLWREGSFCDDFLERRYHTPVEVCGEESEGEPQIKCFWNPQNAHAATCDIENLMIRPQKLWKAMDNVQGTFPHSGSVGLLQNDKFSCEKSTIHNLARTMEGGDYVKWFVDDLITNAPIGKSTCDHWINETAFFFSSHSHHIYFRFLAYYAIHKNLLDHHVEPGNYRIFRLTEGFNYIFPDYERALFPGIQPVTDLPDTSICFSRAVLVPKCYATVLFQCKMQYEIRDKCIGCNGRGLSGTSLQSFRSRALAACGLKDTPKNKQDPMLITVILRKPYTRWRGDHPSSFERVLSNSEELITALEKSFPDAIVKALHMEELTICQQISYTHDADFLIGVHGAGLVHLWWLREEAVMMELEPYFEIGNPSFKTLAKLTGRRYVGIPIRGTSGGVTVTVGDVIKQIKSLL